jgi:DNA-binding NtrC family response regulator
MDPAETAKVHALLHECGAEVFTASCCAEAGRIMDRGVPIRAIFSAQRLPDGRFHDCVQMAGRRAEPMPVIVFLSEIDGGWIDLLEAGAFDLVVEPYRREKIERVLAAIPHYTRVPAGAGSGRNRARSVAG